VEGPDLPGEDQIHLICRFLDRDRMAPDLTVAVVIRDPDRGGPCRSPVCAYRVVNVRQLLAPRPGAFEDIKPQPEIAGRDLDDGWVAQAPGGCKACDAQGRFG